jgi:hypothetical protein
MALVKGLFSRFNDVGVGVEIGVADFEAVDGPAGGSQALATSRISSIGLADKTGGEV